MEEYSITLASKTDDYEALKEAIITHLLSDKSYLLRFYHNKPEEEIDSSVIMLIRAEYGRVSPIMLNLEKEYDNFNYDNVPANTIRFAKWMTLCVQGQEIT